ncbi:MAG: hypothetical protein E7539_01935 [Ruminococcaceae bacterium]|nr:hypothetical protein [Oscillospiraceae bacterium]
MKKKITIISIAAIVVLAIVAVIVFSPKFSIDREVIKANAPIGSTEAKYLNEELVVNEAEYALIGKSGDNELYFKKADYSIKVKNTKTGQEWSSMVSDEEYIHNADMGYTENTEIDRQNLRKLFEFAYTNFDQISLNTSLATESDAAVKLHKIENGVAIEAAFPSCEISVTVEFWVDETGLNVRVPKDKIVESGDNGIVSISLLPMLDAVKDDVKDAFALFPDSTGGIYDVKPIAIAQSPLFMDVYFPRSFDLDEIQASNEQGVKNAMMPFFGLSKGNKGFVGYVSEGEMNSFITLNPSGSIYNLTRINASLNYRKSYNYTNPSGDVITTVEKNISAGNFAVKYMFIGGSETDKITYSDMAVSLRKYLTDTGRLVKAESAKSEGVEVNLQMIMSSKVETMIAEYLQVMTSCEDIENMVKALPDSIKDDIRIMMLGWQSSGYNVYPSSGKAAREIGSIKKLSQFLEDNGIDSYVVDDLIYATTASKHFSVQGDAVYNEAILPVTDSENKQYVRNPFKEYSKLTKTTLPYFEKNSVNGVGFDKVGWYVFDDYQRKSELNRQDVVSVYNAMIKAVKEAEMKVANQRGNAYVLSNTDYIYDLPKTGSTYELLDREVPFYQLVVHGYIPYSLDIPGNMSVDYTVEKLKWIEYGAEPTFLLTEEMSEKFKDSTVDNAFSTELATWIDDVKAIAEEFNSKLAFTGNSTIEEHTQVAANVYRLTYSNGNKVYVNYNQSDITIDNVTVKAQNYAVVNANGSIVG